MTGKEKMEKNSSEGLLWKDAVRSRRRSGMRRAE